VATLRTGPIPTAAAEALGIGVDAPSTPSVTTTPRQNLEHSHDTELWRRIALLVGLDRMIGTDAKDLARVVVQPICDEYLTE
jgi:hypothetical protein